MGHCLDSVEIAEYERIYYPRQGDGGKLRRLGEIRVLVFLTSQFILESRAVHYLGVDQVLG
jgi:hypothetical protein